MFGQFIRALLYLIGVAICFYILLYVLAAIGIIIPATILTLIKVAFVLIAILIMWNLFGGYFSGFDWWGRNNRRPPPTV